MSALAQSMLARVERLRAELEGLDDRTAALEPAPGKWSAKQVLGHLVDSALHNHARMVRALEKDDLVFEGYDQEAWVRAQGYPDVPWNELVSLWAALNRHFARTLTRVPDDVLAAPRHPHSLDRIAWRPVPAEAPATLRYLVEDYLGHLEHHMGQIRRTPASA